jgi:hypothetical protein
MKFKLDYDADINGTCLKNYVEASYEDLEALFGAPMPGDDYKVSGEWVFESEEGDVVTLYDWKETSLYDSGLPSVEEFRTRNNICFHVGANSGMVAHDFIEWLESQLRDIRKYG